MPTAVRLNIGWQVDRLPASGGAAQDCLTTHDFSGLSEPWPTGGFNYEDAELRTDDWFAAIDTYLGRHTSLVEYRWYVRGGHTDPLGAPDRITSRALTGPAANNNLPSQCAIVVTELTDAEGDGDRPRNWGRFYLPGPATTAMDTDGSTIADARVAIADATREWYDWMIADAGLQPIVHGRTNGLPVDREIRRLQVDDVFDVQRRRRFARAQRYRSIFLNDPNP